MTPSTDPATLRQHASELALAFDVRIITDARLRPDEACGLPHIRVALCAPISDETTYAVVLHELGHLCSPTGVLRGRPGVVQPDANVANVRRTEEDAAWTWARHFALVWTPVMEMVAQWAEGTYAEPAPRSAPPPATEPAPPAGPYKRTINWKDWK